MHTVAEASIDTKMLHEILKEAKEGEVLSYSHLSSVIGRDVRREARGCMDSALRRALRDGLVFEAVRGEGYRLLPDEKIAGVGLSAVRKIRRAATRAAKKLSCVRDFSSMSNEARVQHNVGVSILGAIAHSSTTHAVKRVEKVVAESAATLPLAKTLEAFRG